MIKGDVLCGGDLGEALGGGDVVEGFEAEFGATRGEWFYDSM